MFHMRDYCLSDVEDVKNLSFFINYFLSIISMNKPVYFILNSKNDYEILKIIENIYHHNPSNYRLKITIKNFDKFKNEPFLR